MFKPLLKLDLQLFSDEFGAYDPSTAYEGIEAVDEPLVQPEGQPEGQGEMVPPVVEEPPLLDFGGRKIQATNEEMLGLHKDFMESQRYITALQGQVNALQQMAQQMQMQPQGQPQVQQQDISNVENWTEETWQEFYDKPQDIIGKIVQQSIEQFAAEKLDPILQERQWGNEIQRMYNNFPDFDTYIGDVQSLIEQYPQYADEGGLEAAYYRAKATRSNVNPAQLAQDPNFLNQYVFSNPQVQQQMVGQYLQNKQQTNQQLPTMMGRGAGGFTPQTPDASPQTLKEASRMFLKQQGIR